MGFDRVRQLESVSIPDLLREIFPEPVDVRDVGHHEDLRNYVVAVDGKYILKVYGSKDRWERELRNLARIRRSHFRTPVLLDWGMVNPHNGWLLTDIVPGQILEDCLGRLDRERKEKLWFRVGGLLADFHRANEVCDADAAHIVRVGQAYQVQSHRERLIRDFKSNRSRIEKDGYYGREKTFRAVFDEIESWIAVWEKQNPRTMAVLCHGDFSARNLLYCREDDSFGLIDFELGSCGRPEYDFSRIALDLIREGLFDRFLDGYFMAGAVVERDDAAIRACILLKIVEICSWSFRRAPDYFTYALESLRLV